MNYQETLDFLFLRLPMYQRVGKSAYKKDLNNTIELLKVLGNPHHSFKSVHIAGTNGKGTSAHGIASILQTAGYKTGLYTSPHLKNFTERIKIDGHEVDQEFVVDFVKVTKQDIARINPSFFELTVAMAFSFFAKMQVDIAIIETGLGGRLDSTNVIIPEVCLITNIGYDHMDMLGNTLEAIAFEKAGIIKPGVPVVLGSHQEEVFHVFEEKAKENKSNLTVASPYEWKAPPVFYPYHKKINTAGIVGVVKELQNQEWKITKVHVEEGLKNMESLTGFKGRFQVLGRAPLIIADVSHNKEGLELLIPEVLSQSKGQLYLIFGSVRGKNLEPIFKLFPKEAKLILSLANVPRALPVSELIDQAKIAGLNPTYFADVNSSLKYAIKNANANDTILITGSTFLVAEIDQL